MTASVHSEKPSEEVDDDDVIIIITEKTVFHGHQKLPSAMKKSQKSNVNFKIDALYTLLIMRSLGYSLGE